MTKKASPSSPSIKNYIFAFVIGGLICVLGQLLGNLYEYLGADKEDAKTYVSITLILIAAILTALHIFSKLAKHAGAGTLVPITGFANSVVSPAMEYKAEGQISGLGTKIFTIAGPVILYGVTASFIYGIIYWIWTLFSGGAA